MNKLRHNNKIFAYVKLRPIKCIDLEIPEDETKASELVESIYNHLLYDELEHHKSFIRKKPGTDKYILSIWSDNRYTYLVQCIRSEMNTDVIVIYMTPNTKNSVSDYIAAAKMVHHNLSVMTNELVEAYKGEIIENHAEKYKGTSERTSNTKPN